MIELELGVEQRRGAGRDHASGSVLQNRVIGFGAKWSAAHWSGTRPGILGITQGKMIAIGKAEIGSRVKNCDRQRVEAGGHIDEIALALVVFVILNTDVVDTGFGRLGRGRQQPRQH